jgi:hypothetical protein
MTKNSNLNTYHRVEIRKSLLFGAGKGTIVLIYMTDSNMNLIEICILIYFKCVPVGHNLQ